MRVARAPSPALHRPCGADTLVRAASFGNRRRVSQGSAKDTNRQPELGAQNQRRRVLSMMFVARSKMSRSSPFSPAKVSAKARIRLHRASCRSRSPFAVTLMRIRRASFPSFWIRTSPDLFRPATIRLIVGGFTRSAAASSPKVLGPAIPARKGRTAAPGLAPTVRPAWRRCGVNESPPSAGGRQSPLDLVPRG